MSPIYSHGELQCMAEQDRKIQFQVEMIMYCYVYYADINECLGKTHGCEETCINYDGGYRCECQIGLTLDNDYKSCIRKYRILIIFLIKISLSASESS